MGYEGRTAELTVAQAQELLADSVPGVQVVKTQQVAFTNDVFRTLSRSHGNYYIKFHTARWYVDLPDTACVVDRELAGHELLARRGMALPYRMWGDCSGRVVPRAALISEHLVGEPVSSILKRQPEATEPLVEELGRYLRRLHSIEFSHRAPLSLGLVRSAGPSGRIVVPPQPPEWDSEDRPTIRRGRGRLGGACDAGVVDTQTAQELEKLLDAAPATGSAVGPRFTLKNCHLPHFHALPADGGWQVTGVYDFEAVSADYAGGDVMELEFNLTPVTGGFAWRHAFERGYGEVSDFPRYKVRLLNDLLYYMGEFTRAGRFGEKVPDIPWLSARLVQLAKAQCWRELEWFPAAQA